MKLSCEHCRRPFDSSEGYSGSAERPFCLQPLCLAAYLAPERAVIEVVNGFDNVQYTERALGTRARS